MQRLRNLIDRIIMTPQQFEQKRQIDIRQADHQRELSDITHSIEESHSFGKNDIDRIEQALFRIGDDSTPYHMTIQKMVQAIQKKYISYGHEKKMLLRLSEY